MKQLQNTKTRQTFLLRGTQGQAAVEYILLVTIAVSLIIALKGFFKQAGELTNQYVGLYITCLMEYGELPSLGVQNSELKNHQDGDEKCSPKFKPFTVTEGRPPVSNSASSQASARDKRSDQNNSASGQTESASSKNGGGGGSSRGGRKGAAPASPYDDGSIRRQGRSTADGAAESKVTLLDDESESRAYGRNQRQTRTIYRQRDRYRAITGEQAAQYEKSARQVTKRTPTSRTIAKTEDGRKSGPRTGLLPMPTEKPKIVQEEADSGWGFGKLIKWLLIIGMIVAIVIFFGGQILNYSNSDS